MGAQCVEGCNKLARLVTTAQPQRESEIIRVQNLAKKRLASTGPAAMMDAIQKHAENHGPC
eukprot:1032513-Alexandrium_andersonii.AAC.1